MENNQNMQQNTQGQGQNMGQQNVNQNNQNSMANNSGMHYGSHAYANNPYIRNEHKSTLSDIVLGKTATDRFIRGLAIGALATYLLTNENAQKAVAKGSVKLYEGVVGGFEELKEKFMDAKADYESSKEA